MNKTDICQLLPHDGKMCLLDQIVFWDESKLTAATMSHIKVDNPLSLDGVLGSIIGVEYAAQAMAVHAALVRQKQQHNEGNEQQEQQRGGYLATIRNIRILAEHLSPPGSGSCQPLIISVSVLMMDSQGFTYQFEISSNNTLILCGKITLFLTN